MTFINKLESEQAARKASHTASNKDDKHERLREKRQAKKTTSNERQLRDWLSSELQNGGYPKVSDKFTQIETIFEYFRINAWSHRKVIRTICQSSSVLMRLQR